MTTTSKLTPLILLTFIIVPLVPTTGSATTVTAATPAPTSTTTTTTSKPAPAPAPSTAHATVAAETAPCSKIALYDLKNAMLSVKDGVALASTPNGDDALPFKNGICELKDNPTSNTPDWRYEMVSDFVMRPTRNNELRVLRIFENHLSGSGSWDRVMIFECHKGSLEKIWQRRFPAETNVKQVNEIQFKITGKSHDPQLGLYQWDARHDTFVLRHH